MLEVLASQPVQYISVIVKLLVFDVFDNICLRELVAYSGGSLAS